MYFFQGQDDQQDGEDAVVEHHHDQEDGRPTSPHPHLNSLPSSPEDHFDNVIRWHIAETDSIYLKVIQADQVIQEDGNNQDDQRTVDQNDEIPNHHHLVRKENLK